MVGFRATATATRVEFDRIFSDLLPRLYRRAFALTGSQHTAEDALHDAYLKLVIRPEALVRHPLPYAYAFATVLSVVRDGWRRGQREVPHGEVADLVVTQWDSGTTAWEAEQETVRLLRHLTAKQAAIVLLVDVDGCTIDQAADVLGLHRGTVSRARGRALDKLRSLFAPEPSADRGPALSRNERNGGGR
jgi:RNA polymerase sigma factor (sigma-70 family)